MQHTELFWLTLTVLMTSLMWLPYIANRMREQGLGNILWNAQGNPQTQVIWAERNMRAHQNAVENLVIFAPLVLTLQVAGISNQTTAIACTVYFFARAAHYVAFSLGVPGLRIPTFAVGVACQIVLALALLAGL